MSEMVGDSMSMGPSFLTTHGVSGGDSQQLCNSRFSSSGRNEVPCSFSDDRTLCLLLFATQLDGEVSFRGLAILTGDMACTLPLVTSSKLVSARLISGAALLQFFDTRLL